MNCVFCTWLNGQETEFKQNSDIVYQDLFVTSFVAPKAWKNNLGNVVVIPNQHWQNIYEIPQDLHRKVYDEVQTIAKVMKKSYGCTGVSTRQHNDRDGNQGIMHFHTHVIPRYKDDNLYINHKETVHVPIEKRKNFANKLKESYVEFRI